MNKSERLNDMLRFLADKDRFNLSDLMNQFSISKSTALRDIQSLEKIGMPIYSQPGRNGYYGVLPNRLLSPILFTFDEVFALYFSMLTLRDYQTTPFHFSIDKLKEKFAVCISAERREALLRIEKVLHFGSIKHYNQCGFLDSILQYAIEEKTCKVRYGKNGVERTYHIQFFDISSAHGQWYATGYHFEANKPKVFRCDRILSVQPSEAYPPRPFSDFLKSADMLYKTSNATEFEVKIAQGGVDIFHKEHYPSMTLCSKDGGCSIRGFYNKGEEDFIASYFIGYGNNILSIWPFALKELIVNKLSALQLHFAEI